MTIKEFLQDKTLTAVGVVENTIINLITEDGNDGIDVNTSNISSGILVITRTDFTINDNILSIDDITIDIETTNML
jgi:hypothetical protein